jgi:hypothetical protein
MMSLDDVMTKTYFYPKIEIFLFPSKDHHRWHMLELGA